MRKWLRRKSARLCLSLLAGGLAVSFTGDTADMKCTKDSRNTVAWWGLLYPDFCRTPAEESTGEQDSEEAQPEYTFWIVEFIKNL